MERVEFDEILSKLDALYITDWRRKKYERNLNGYNYGIDAAIDVLKEHEPESGDGR